MIKLVNPKLVEGKLVEIDGVALEFWEVSQYKIGLPKPEKAETHEHECSDTGTFDVEVRGPDGKVERTGTVRPKGGYRDLLAPTVQVMEILVDAQYVLQHRCVFYRSVLGQALHEVETLAAVKKIIISPIDGLDEEYDRGLLRVNALTKRLLATTNALQKFVPKGLAPGEPYEFKPQGPHGQAVGFA